MTTKQHIVEIVGAILTMAIFFSLSFFLFKDNSWSNEKNKSLGAPPANLKEISDIKKDFPELYNVISYLYHVYRKTPPGTYGCTKGLAPGKIADESILQILEQRGYITRLQNDKWNAVLIPCDRESKVVKDVEGLESYERGLRVVPTPIKSATST